MKNENKPDFFNRFISFLKHLPPPSPLMVVISSLLTGMIYIFLGAAFSILFNGLPLNLFGMMLLIGLIMLFFYHKIQKPIFILIIYTLFVLWVIISIDLIEITYYHHYLGKNIQENEVLFFLKNYRDGLWLLYSQPGTFFKILYNMYGFLGYAWYPSCILVVIGLFCYTIYKDKNCPEDKVPEEKDTDSK